MRLRTVRTVTLPSGAEVTVTMERRGTRFVTVAVTITGTEVTEDDLRKVRVAGHEAAAVLGTPFQPRAKLTRPTGNPDEFYHLVAQAYLEYAVTTRAAAKSIAEEANVPTATVHRWIREARHRGHLPPARRGRTG